jgi:hypothetical protein
MCDANHGWSIHTSQLQTLQLGPAACNTASIVIAQHQSDHPACLTSNPVVLNSMYHKAAVDAAAGVMYVYGGVCQRGGKRAPADAAVGVLHAFTFSTAAWRTLQTTGELQPQQAFLCAVLHGGRHGSTQGHVVVPWAIGACSNQMGVSAMQQHLCLP